MVSINYSAREVCCKIVYYGPGLSGKTTNLQYVHSKVPQNTRGNLISLATEADRTLYFDFLPINIGTINGFAARFQLYTVPGQVYYNATRKLVLRGVDGVVFVADSQPDKMEENIESLLNLEENLKEYGYDMDELPIVIQYNKRDLPGVLSVQELNQRLNTHNWPHFEATAPTGGGVFDTLKLIIKIVLDKAKTTKTRTRASAVQVEQPAPQQAAPARQEIPSYPADRPQQPAAAASAAEALGLTPPQGLNIAAMQEHAAPSAPQPAASTGGYHRPYPGSTGGIAVADRKNAEPAHAQSNTGQMHQSPFTAPGNGHDGAHAQTQTESGRVRPAMAPPLKRRPEAKKRGFFKRLFGIR